MSGPSIYKHDLSFTPEAPYLSDSAMIEVFNGRPTLCVDILLIDRENKEFILPWRTRKPAEGLWFFGGMIKRNMPPKQMAATILSREAGIKIDPDGLEYLNASWFEWDYRDGEDGEKGRVDFNLCFTFEATTAELAAITSNLSSDEYNTEHGLKAYTRQELATAIATQSPCKKVLIDYMDQIFA